ncbi:MAG: ABC transporter permease [Thaumarchaeota archaeon]|nr:ABC transporter permease [Nitrososphaerota archaeon]
MKRIVGSGSLTGFKNKAREENGRWWNTRKWLIQSVVWLLIINGISSIALVQLMHTEATFTLGGFVTVFAGLMGWMVAFGIIILTQSDIVQEKESGTAEWVLSSPLSRVSFILSKLLVNLAWLLAILVLLQGVVFNMVIGALGAGSVPWPLLAQGLALQGLQLVFWLSLVLMLGTFFKTRNPVIGVPLIFLFLQTLIPTIVGPSNSWVSLVLPHTLPEYSAILMNGGQLPSLVPLATTVGASLVFVFLAILRFNREEFKGT